jgi:guanylate kinase
MEFAAGNEYGGRPVYDATVVNDDLDTAYAAVEAFCLAEVGGGEKA